MNRDRKAVDDLKAQANRRMSTVLAKLGITQEAKGSKSYILMSNPRRTDANPSFAVWTKGGIITFKDFADSTAQGDVLDLVSYLNGWWDLPHRGFVESVRWLEDVLGLKTMTAEQRAADARRAKAFEKKEREKSDADLRRFRGLAKEMFYNAKDYHGTPVETYLREARGLDLSQLPAGPRGGKRDPHAIRYIPDHKHVWQEKNSPQNGQSSSWPAMVTACVNPASGDVLAVHRTWLMRDGGGKAPVKPARKVWPDFGGLVMPLWKGASRMSVRDAVANGLCETLVIVEGVEDGFSAVLAKPEYRTWGAISLSNIANIVLPDNIDSVIVHQQNDWAKPQAVASFKDGIKSLKAQGRPVEILRAYRGKDINDTYREVG